jgi:hypothetical protein
MQFKSIILVLSVLVFVIGSSASDAAEKITVSDTVDKTYEFAVDARKATVKTDKVIPLSQVRDISLLREVQKELRSH